MILSILLDHCLKFLVWDILDLKIYLISIKHSKEKDKTYSQISHNLIKDKIKYRLIYYL